MRVLVVGGFTSPSARSKVLYLFLVGFRHLGDGLIELLLCLHVVPDVLVFRAEGVHLVPRVEHGFYILLRLRRIVTHVLVAIIVGRKFLCLKVCLLDKLKLAL